MSCGCNGNSISTSCLTQKIARLEQRLDELTSGRKSGGSDNKYHNDLQGLQGGANGSYYHLTSNELREVQDIQHNLGKLKDEIKLVSESNGDVSSTITNLQSEISSLGSRVTELETKIEEKADKNHNHDDRYSQLNHRHNWDDIQNSPNIQQMINDAVSGITVGNHYVYTGENVPEASLGDNNDAYIDVLTGKFYKKTGGDWSEMNIAGAGNNGKDGFSFLSGDNAPDNSVGKNGDLYLNKANSDVYKKESDAWGVFTNIKGVKGDSGEKGENGHSPQIRKGDTHIQVLTSSNSWENLISLEDFKGDKGDKGENYTWIRYSANSDGVDMTELPASDTVYIGIAVNKDTATPSTENTDYVWFKIKGENGVNGSDGNNGQNGSDGLSLHSGSSAPANSLGKQGDTYINYTNGSVYKKQSADSWTQVGDLLGDNSNYAIPVSDNIVLNQSHAGKTLAFENTTNINVDISNLPPYALVTGIKSKGAGTVTITGSTAPTSNNVLLGELNKTFSLVKLSSGTSNLLMP